MFFDFLVIIKKNKDWIEDLILIRLNFFFLLQMLFFIGFRRKLYKDKKNLGFYYEEIDLLYIINFLEVNLGERKGVIFEFIVFI